MHFKWKSGTPLSQETGGRTTDFANVIWCNSVDFSGAILVYTCRRFSEFLGMRILNEVFMGE